MKIITFTAVLSFILMLSGCSDNKKTLAPSTIYKKEIEFFVQKTLDSSSNRHKETFLYKFRDDNTYQVTSNQKTVFAGNFSYHYRKNDMARIVCTYSERNVLASYEIILSFKTPSSGTWESSYNASTIGAEAGTFIILEGKK